MEKEKQRRAWLGLRRKDAKKKENKRRRSGGGGKGFAKKVAEYFLSDSYMYAPIATCPLSPSLPAQKITASPATSPATTQDKPVSVAQLRRLLVDEHTSPTSPLCR